MHQEVADGAARRGQTADEQTELRPGLTATARIASPRRNPGRAVTARGFRCSAANLRAAENASEPEDGDDFDGREVR